MEKSDSEILAIVLGVDAVRAADILKKAGGLTRLQGADARALGLTAKQAERLAAFFALEARHLKAGMLDASFIRDPESVVQYYAGTLRDLPRETFRVLMLDKKHSVLSEFDMGLGTVDRMMVHPREIVKAAIAANASAVCLVHNHPSGQTDPSPEDREITSRLATALEMLGIKVLDHLIIGGNKHFSFREHGFI